MRKKYRKQYKVRKKKSILKNKYFWFSILGVLLLVGSIYFIIFSPVFQIKEIKITAPEGMPKDTLEKIIEEKISQKILFFPTESIFLAQLKKIKIEIEKRFPPHIKQASLKRKFLSSLIVQIQERIPAANFCQEQEGAKKCFFIDDEGVIFNEAFPIKKPPSLIINGNKKQPAQAGSQALATEEITAILKIQNELEQEPKIGIQEAIVEADKLIINTIENWNIYFDIKEDVAEQIFNLRALLDEGLLEGRAIEYINLRYGNRIFYK